MLKNFKIIISPQIWYIILGGFFMSIFNHGYSQVTPIKVDQYLTGNEKKIEMIVHIWGEVKNPGEYRVSDNTNILELISKAGGPTEYSNIKNIMLTRETTSLSQLSTGVQRSELDSNQSQFSSTENTTNLSKRVIEINLAQYLKSQQPEDLPVLQPGDVIYIKRNSWFRWQTAIRLISQFALIFQALYYFSHID